MVGLADKKRKQKEEKPEHEPVLKMVQNVTRVPQSVGRGMLRPGASDVIDCAKGTLGERLVQTGVLEIASETPGLDMLEGRVPAPVQYDSSQPTKQYQCPFCQEVFEQAEGLVLHLADTHVAAVNKVATDMAAAEEVRAMTGEGAAL